MLNGAMVLMILAGIFGLPAVLCSGCMSGCVTEIAMHDTAKEAQEVQAFFGSIMYLSIAASIGSIIVGALVKKLKKVTSCIACFIFAVIFALLLIQGNFLGLVSSIMLLIASVMIFVAPAEQFKDIAKVRIS